MITDTKTKYSFFIAPHIYYNQLHQDIYILYDTKTGKYIEGDSEKCNGLINKVYHPENLGTIVLDNEELNDQEILDFINLIRDNKFGDLLVNPNDKTFLST